MSGIMIKDVVKKYGDVMALGGITINFEDNKIYGLLGRNGAGKSTLLNVITNRVFADSGEVFLHGQSIRENDRQQGKIYLMSEQTFYPDGMKIKNVFRWSKEFYKEFDEAYAVHLAELFGIDLKQKVKNLSTGYTSIFKLITALSVNVPYLIFDEPVLGLDANHRDLFYSLLIEKYSEKPCTIIISTHLIEEVAHLIEEVILIDKGKILLNETREELYNRTYAVSGFESEVDGFCMGKDIIGEDRLGGLKTVYLWGKVSAAEVPHNLELSKIDLQKLFVKITGN